jgi:branched-chain amino acid transport system permease protein
MNVGAAEVEIPPTPVQVQRWSLSSRVGTGTYVAAAIALALLPFWGDASLQLTMVEILYFLSLAQMWNLLAGYAGLVSVGQHGLIGVSAYTLLVLAERRGYDPFIAMVLAGVFVAALSIPIALFAFRLSGGYFAIGTWVIAEVLRLTTLRIDSLNAGNVQSLTPKKTFAGYELQQRVDYVYWAALFLAVGGTIIVVAVLRSRLGLALQAVRDDEPGARGLGVKVTRTKLIVWIIVSFWTGMTGAMIHLKSLTIVNTSAFDLLNFTALVVFIVVIGGVGSTAGPIIGVAIYWFITWQLEDSNTWRFIILGGMAVLVAVASRGGVNGLLQRIRPFELFPIRRRLRS